MTSLATLRKTLQYRIFESILALTTYGFFIFILGISFFYPEISAAIILLYSFGWLLRVALINLYTLFTFKNLLRWKKVHAWKWLQLLATYPEKAGQVMREFRDLHRTKLNHTRDLDYLISGIHTIQNTKYQDPTKIWQLPIFAIYNESPAVLERSLKAVYESEYDLKHIIVFITQEARLGMIENKLFRAKIAELEWVQISEMEDIPLETIFHGDHATFKYKNKNIAKLKLDPQRLNIIFTAHPDGLLGEIKGKASNEDWAGRTISLVAKARGIDPELAIVTSLDADSSVSKDYFALLSLRYALTDKRTRFGFQSIPVYTKNIFETTLIPRLIAFQTTLWTMAQNGMEGKTHFFANYSVPLIVLQEADFWDREHIAEDYIFFARCFKRYNGDFKVLPFYGMFNGDAVIGDDYIHAIENQYKQHQRWSWGGVESIAYLLHNLFVVKNTIPMHKKLSEFVGIFINHHFWATAPMLFSIGILLPAFFGGIAFEQSSIAQNLILFSTYFALISYSFVVIFAFISYDILQRTADLRQASQAKQVGIIVLQALFTPFVYGFMAIPAINAQTRGLFGNYLGYWVTPKK